MILTENEIRNIEEWRHGLKNDILLQLSIKDSEAGRQISAFCTELADLVPEISLKNIRDEDLSISGIMIGRNIIYCAVPVSNEFVPFLDALSPVASAINDIPHKLQSALLKIKTPAMLKIYISPHCTFCPRAVTQCLTLARANPVIEITVIDGSLYPEQAARDKIRSVPTLILDDSFRWTGSIDLEELINVIAERDPMLLGAETFKNIIHDGRAEEVADMMFARGQVFPAFLDLITDTKWTVRLGAMAAYAYLADRSPGLCNKVNVDLCDRFMDLDYTVQGDVIFLLGESGDRSVIPFLDSIIKGNFAPEVIEAALDAMANFSITSK